MRAPLSASPPHTLPARPSRPVPPRFPRGLAGARSDARWRPTPPRRRPSAAPGAQGPCAMTPGAPAHAPPRARDTLGCRAAVPLDVPTYSSLHHLSSFSATAPVARSRALRPFSSAHSTPSSHDLNPLPPNSSPHGLILLSPP